MKYPNTFLLISVLSSLIAVEASHLGWRDSNTTSIKAKIDPGEWRTHPSTIRIRLDRRLRNFDYIFTAPDLTYMGTIGIGTPERTLNVAFDLGSSDTWLSHKSQISLRLGFDADQSSTSRYNGKSHIISMNTILYCWDYQDVFTLHEDTDFWPDIPQDDKKKVQFDLPFCAAHNQIGEQFTHKPFDGIIGLSPKTEMTYNFPVVAVAALQGRDEREPVITKPKDRISDLVMGLVLNDEDSSIGGELTIGGLDVDKIGGVIENFHSVSEFWVLNITEVSLNQLIISHSATQAKLVSVSEFIYGPRKDVEAIYRELQAEVYYIHDLALVRCDRRDSLPPLTFKIDAVKYDVSQLRYVRKFQYDGSDFCFLTIKPSDGEDWTLGTSFLAEFVTILDFGKKQVSFATKKNPK